MNKRKEYHLSKFFALILRHQAIQFGLTPDEHHFVSLNQFIDVVKEKYEGVITTDEILYVL